MNEDEATQKQTDRDILVDMRAEMRHVKENQEKLEARLDVRFEQMETRHDLANDRTNKRVDALVVEVDALKKAQWTQQGGLNFGRWMVGALTALPFLGGLLGFAAATWRGA